MGAEPGKMKPMATDEPGESLDDDAAALEDDTLRHKEPFFELLSPPSARRTVVLGIIGATAFFAI